MRKSNHLMLFRRKKIKKNKEVTIPQILTYTKPNR